MKSLNNLLSKEKMKEVFGGDELRKFRNEVCYSQEYVAKQLNITQSTYQRLEAGEIKISLERLAKIAEIFKKPLVSLMKKDADTVVNNHNETEIQLLQKIILQQEKRITELEEKIERRNHKIEMLKQQLNF